MKYLIPMVFAAGVIAGSAYYLQRENPAPDSSQAVVADIAAPMSTEESATDPGPGRREARAVPNESPKAYAASRSTPQPVVAPLDLIALGQAVDLLVSAQASYAQKQATWKQLRERGCLDQATAELEQRRGENPNNPECAAVLGQAYLQKCGTISDVREQGILAMQADKLFDASLSLDPANWEARFTKAVALSYWPASMGKGDEVIQHFTTLIEQQESSPQQQPQFAEPYVWLGDQYQKAGRAEDARSVWARGAGFFPNNQQLKDKLAAL